MFTFLLSLSVPARRKVEFLMRKATCEPEEPIAVGYWGKPSPLVEAKNDFLCLTATLTSTEEPANLITLGQLLNVTFLTCTQKASTSVSVLQTFGTQTWSGSQPSNAECLVPLTLTAPQSHLVGTRVSITQHFQLLRCL